MKQKKSVQVSHLRPHDTGKLEVAYENDSLDTVQLSQ